MDTNECYNLVNNLNDNWSNFIEYYNYKNLRLIFNNDNYDNLCIIEKLINKFNKLY